MKIPDRNLNFQIEPSEGCEYDYVEVRDGGDESSPLLKKACGSQRPPNSIQSTGNQMFVKFHADDIEIEEWQGRKGFKAVYYRTHIEDCKDVYPAFNRCPMWANSGYCNKYPFMEEFCKVSCNLC